jgi:hypothetical protein
MPSMTADSAHVDEIRAELHSILQSQSFARSPGLSRLLSYLCEKVLADYYASEGKEHKVHIAIPIGTYVPVVEEHGTAEAGVADVHIEEPHRTSNWRLWALGAAWVCIVAAAVSTFFILRRSLSKNLGTTVPAVVEPATPKVGLPVGDETRILGGSTRSYVDRSGKLWNPDAYFTGGTAVRSSVQHIWRTQDPAIYRSSRQGDFSYDIPLRPGVYELRLHFAETYYGPEDPGGGGEGSRVMNVAANGKPLIAGLDVLADASGGRTADVKVFSDISPAQDGVLHLTFSSATGRGMVSAIEILPGYRSRMRPVRIVARDIPYYSNDSQWWSSDAYFKGGQFAGSEEAVVGTDDPELYETERWGHFSYAIPVTPGQYRLTLHFVERGGQRIVSTAPNDGLSGADRIFDVFCNGKLVIRQLNLTRDAGQNHSLVRRISGLQPNAQGKLLLEFAPSSQYATVSAI